MAATTSPLAPSATVTKGTVLIDRDGCKVYVRSAGRKTVRVSCSPNGRMSSCSPAGMARMLASGEFTVA